MTASVCRLKGFCSLADKVWHGRNGTSIPALIPALGPPLFSWVATVEANSQRPGVAVGWRVLERGAVHHQEVVMRGRHIMAGFRRIGIVLAVILAVPVGFGLWTWATLGHAPPRYVYLYLAAGLGAYILASAIGWILAGFAGEDDE